MRIIRQIKPGDSYIRRAKKVACLGWQWCSAMKHVSAQIRVLDVGVFLGKATSYTQESEMFFNSRLEVKLITAVLNFNKLLQFERLRTEKRCMKEYIGRVVCFFLVQSMVELWCMHLFWKHFV